MLKSIIKTSIIALATFTALSAAHATDEPLIFEEVTNEQVNLTDVLSDILINVGTVGELAKIEGSALGNNFVLSAEGTGPIDLETTQQSNTDNIISRINLTVDKTPKIDINSEAIANKAIVINKAQTGSNIINNTQTSGAALPPPPPPRAPVPRGCGCADPLSDVTVTAQEIDELDLDSTAGGNLAQFVLGGSGNTIVSSQENDVMNNSLVDVNIGSITKDLDVNSRAWGNSLVLVLGNVPTDTSN